MSGWYATCDEGVYCPHIQEIIMAKSKKRNLSENQSPALRAALKAVENMEGAAKVKAKPTKLASPKKAR